MLLASVAKSGSVDVDMKPASACLMRFVAELHSLVADIVPRHLVLVIIERHRVRDNLHTVVQRAVGLYVDVLETVPIRLIENQLGIFTVFSALVNFKFNTEKTLAVAVKQRVGLVAVIVDCAAIVLLIAVVAVRVIIAVRVVRFVQVNDSSAVLARCIIAVVAALAECL